ncbi:MAG: hypothetical protein O2800_02560 [Planctomycetota bacterium]|nr:hypothetical protein [Planctomycetota bacterium]
MSTSAQSTDRASLIRLAGDGAACFSLPHSHYILQLVAPAGSVGKVEVTIRAKALKMHKTTAGGIFIEPVEGAPRIVQGRILETDATNNRILANIIVPMWIDVPQGQAASAFRHGDLANFYLESGARFEPA